MQFGPAALRRPPGPACCARQAGRRGCCGGGTSTRGTKYETDFSNVPLARQQDWSVDDADTAQEEARLLYVAMTRAKEELILFVDPRTKDERRVADQLGRAARGGG